MATGLTVLILAREPTPPSRRLGAECRASADGLAAARSFALLDARAAISRGGPRQASSPALAAVRFEGVSLSAAGRDGLVRDGLDLELPLGRRWRSWVQWSRQEHGRAAARAAGPDRGPCYGGWRRTRTGCIGCPPRALLAGAAVLVLDQPTAHLDPRTASDLIEDVFSAAGNQTVLPITHRSEGLDRVDRWSAWRRMK